MLVGIGIFSLAYFQILLFETVIYFSMLMLVSIEEIEILKNSEFKI